MTYLRSQSKTDRQEPCHELKVIARCPPQGPMPKEPSAALAYLSTLVAAAHSYGAIEQDWDKATWQIESPHSFPIKLITDPAAMLDVTWNILRAHNDQLILQCPRGPDLILEHSRQGRGPMHPHQEHSVRQCSFWYKTVN